MHGKTMFESCNHQQISKERNKLQPLKKIQWVYRLLQTMKGIIVFEIFLQ